MIRRLGPRSASADCRILRCANRLEFRVDSPVPPVLQAAFDRERSEASARERVDAATARTETVRMYGRLAALQTQVMADEKVEVACRRGCSYCCHLRVEIRPHEAFVLAHHIRTKFSPEQRARALARIEDVLKRIAPLSREQHVRAGISCALLEEDACSVYEARPATCRKYHSVSVAVCRAAFDDTSAPLIGEIEHENVRLAGNAVALGYAKGVEEAGYDATLYELHYALHRALTDPKAERRYRDGKRAFVG
jgi:Fe-S-cluster containining protein